MKDAKVQCRRSKRSFLAISVHVKCFCLFVVTVDGVKASPEFF